jgi:hypothetical protein
MHTNKEVCDERTNEPNTETLRPLLLAIDIDIDID